MTNAELIIGLRECAVGDCNKCKMHSYDSMCAIKLLLAAADALEAADKRIAELEAQLPKEGVWKFSRGDGKTYADGWTCSACGNSFHTHVPYFKEFHFCPNCGAKMQTVTDCHTLEEGER